MSDFITADQIQRSKEEIEEEEKFRKERQGKEYCRNCGFILGDEVPSNSEIHYVPEVCPDCYKPINIGDDFDESKN